MLTGLIAAIGLSVAVLHGIEAAVWAAAYLGLGALDTAAEAMLFSVDSMSTRGASGLVLRQHWQIMGALEVVAGMLMFGISTAYIFAVMQLLAAAAGDPSALTRRRRAAQRLQPCRTCRCYSYSWWPLCNAAIAESI
jgi:hypothetical protein